MFIGSRVKSAWGGNPFKDVNHIDRDTFTVIGRLVPFELSSLVPMTDVVLSI